LASTPTYPQSKLTFNLDDYGKKGSITPSSVAAHQGCPLERLASWHLLNQVTTIYLYLLSVDFRAKKGKYFFPIFRINITPTFPQSNDYPLFLRVDQIVLIGSVKTHNFFIILVR
jgi:hypothetical protein